jgi:hypothetical protein
MVPWVFQTNHTMYDWSEKPFAMQIGPSITIDTVVMYAGRVMTPPDIHEVPVS